jgi:hypothetical protein
MVKEKTQLVIYPYVKSTNSLAAYIHQMDIEVYIHQMDIEAASLSFI